VIKKNIDNEISPDRKFDLRMLLIGEYSRAIRFYTYTDSAKTKTKLMNNNIRDLINNMANIYIEIGNFKQAAIHNKELFDDMRNLSCLYKTKELHIRRRELHRTTACLCFIASMDFDSAEKLINEKTFTEEIFIAAKNKNLEGINNAVDKKKSITYIDKFHDIIIKEIIKKMTE